MSLLDDASVLITRPNRRSIGTIFPDIVIEEISTDLVQITEHPVEEGAAVTDHAYSRPSDVIMRCGFSNSTGQSEDYVRTMYARIIQVKNQLQPINVTTGKRRYANMLISSLALTTDESSEYALNIVIGLKQIIITSTGGGDGSSPATSNPSQTGAVADRGTQQGAAPSGSSGNGDVTTPGLSPGSGLLINGASPGSSVSYAGGSPQ